VLLIVLTVGVLVVFLLMLGWSLRRLLDTACSALGRLRCCGTKRSSAAAAASSYACQAVTSSTHAPWFRSVWRRDDVSLDEAAAKPRVKDGRPRSWLATCCARVWRSLDESLADERTATEVLLCVLLASCSSSPSLSMPSLREHAVVGVCPQARLAPYLQPADGGSMSAQQRSLQLEVQQQRR
jgi:hypothetical protein